MPTNTDLIRTYQRSVLPDKLKNEINSSYPDLVNMISVRNGVEATVILNRPPTAIEDVAMTDFVNNHVPSLLGYKIWSMVDNPQPSYESPLDIPLKELPLLQKIDFERGLWQTKTFYKSYEQNPITGDVTYSDPVYRTTWTYNMDYLGDEMSARETFEYYLDDDSIGSYTKVKDRIYEGLDKMQFSNERRKRVLLIMMAEVARVITFYEVVNQRTIRQDPSYLLTVDETQAQIQKGRELLRTYSNEADDYERAAHDALAVAVENDANPEFSYLDMNMIDWTTYQPTDQTIRQYISEELRK